MKNPGFLTNGSVVVLKPNKDCSHNTIAVVVGRSNEVDSDGGVEYAVIPVVINPDENDVRVALKSTMKAYRFISIDDVLFHIGKVKDIKDSEWIIVKTINRTIDETDVRGERTIKKFEDTLDEALEEKDFVKFKWIIFNTDLDQYTKAEWIGKLQSNKDSLMESFGVNEASIDACLKKLTSAK